MHIPSLIELLKSISKDIESYKDSKQCRSYAELQDLKVALTKIDSAIYSLTGAERHRKELEDNEE